MSSFREIREVCLVLFEEGVLTEEQFILLYLAYDSRNPEFPYSNYSPFCLDKMNEAECLAEFRVQKHDLIFLQQVLQIPDIIKCPQRTTRSGLEGLCILFNRLAYPCRYSDMIQRIGRSVSELCMISNLVTDLIYDNHGHRVIQWNPYVLSPETFRFMQRPFTKREPHSEPNSQTDLST